MVQDDGERGRHAISSGLMISPKRSLRVAGLQRVNPASDLALDHLQLEIGNRLGRIEALWAGLGAVHDGVAAIEWERVLEIVEPFAGGFIAAVLDPAGRLQQRRRPQEAFAVPPIARA